MPRRAGRQQGIRRYRRAGQTALSLDGTLAARVPWSQQDEEDGMAFIGTCQSCGAYWDVRLRPRCICGGYVG